MPETSIERAFSKAGVISGSARIRAIVDDVLTRGLGFNAAADLLLSEIRDSHDAQLIWEFFAAARERTAKDWLRTGSKAKRERNDGGLGEFEAQNEDAAAGAADGHSITDNLTGSATAARSKRAGNSAGAGQRQPETHSCNAGPTKHPSAAPRADTLAGLKAVSALNRQWLAEQTELGKPLGACEQDEVLALSRRHGLMGRFLARIASRMPLRGALNEHLSEDELQALWRATEKENVGA